MLFIPLAGTVKVFYPATGRSEEFPCEIPPRTRQSFGIEGGEEVAVSIFENGKKEASAEGSVCTSKFVRTPFRASAIAAEDGDRYIRITAGKSAYAVDKTSGRIVSVKAYGRELGGIALNVWRAPTDNDVNEKCGWYEDALDRAICDYIAGMTDQYAIEKYKEKFIPKPLISGTSDETFLKILYELDK